MAIEHQVVLTWRHKDLRHIFQFMQQHSKVLYLDKAYVNLGHTGIMAWTDEAAN